MRMMLQRYMYSCVYPQKSRMYPQKSRMYPQKSPNLCRTQMMLRRKVYIDICICKRNILFMCVNAKEPTSFFFAGDAVEVCIDVCIRKRRSHVSVSAKEPYVCAKEPISWPYTNDVAEGCIDVYIHRRCTDVRIRKRAVCIRKRAHIFVI